MSKEVGQQTPSEHEQTLGRLIIYALPYNDFDLLDRKRTQHERETPGITQTEVEKLQDDCEIIREWVFGNSYHILPEPDQFYFGDVAFAESGEYLLRADKKGVFSSSIGHWISILKNEGKNCLNAEIGLNTLARVSVTFNSRGRLTNRFVYSSGEVRLADLTPDEYAIFKSLTEEFMRDQMGIVLKES